MRRLIQYFRIRKRLAKGPRRGVARGIKKNNFEKKSNFLSLCYPRDTQGFPKKNSANLGQSFGKL